MPPVVTGPTVQRACHQRRAAAAIQRGALPDRAPHLHADWAEIKGAAEAAPWCGVGGTYSAALATRPAMASPPSPAVTSTVSPSLIRPARMSSASGFCSERWITRFSGRAP